MTFVHGLLGQGPSKAVLESLVQIVQEHTGFKIPVETLRESEERLRAFVCVCVLFLCPVEMSIMNNSIFIWTQVISIKMKQISEIKMQGK